MINYIGETRGNVRLPGIMMLGYVGAHSENLAMAVIVSKVSLVVRLYSSIIFVSVLIILLISGSRGKAV